MVDEAPRSRTSGLLSREVQESMGIVWRRNHPRSHVLPSSVALFEELPLRLLFCALGSSGPLVREHVKTLTRSLEGPHLWCRLDAVLGLRDQRRDAISQLLVKVRGEIELGKLWMQVFESIQRSRIHSIGEGCFVAACHAIQVSSRLVPVLGEGMAKQHAARGRFERD